VTLTFDLLTSKVRDTSSVTWTVFTKFERNRAIPGWIIDNFVDFCTRYVTPWPWPLIFWPWTSTALRVSYL